MLRYAFEAVDVLLVFLRLHRDRQRSEKSARQAGGRMERLAGRLRLSHKYVALGGGAIPDRLFESRHMCG